MQYYKQPNGLYCQYSYVGDCLLKTNMTEKDLLRSILEEIFVEQVMQVYFSVLSCDADKFNQIIEWFRTDAIPANELVEKFRSVGCNEEQLARVRERILEDAEETNDD